MRIPKLAHAAVAAALVTGGILTGTGVPAQAADSFQVCSPICSLGDTGGSITWFNRTAGVTGDVTDVGAGSTTAIFEAYAGDRKIDTQTRTANDESSLGSPRGFNFTIGDTNLVGGINRIKITVCFNFGTPIQRCGTPKNYSRT